MDGWKEAVISHLTREFDELAEQKYFQQFDKKILSILKIWILKMYTTQLERLLQRGIN